MAWSAFQTFRGDYHFDILKIPNTEQIALFISYMSWHEYSANTIAAYISGLSFFLRSKGLEDITQVFPIKRLVDGCRRRHLRKDVRCPITLPILQRLVSVLPTVCSNSYDCKLFAAAFLVAFFGFLRVGEFTAKNGVIPLVSGDVAMRGESPHRRLAIKVRFSKTDQLGAGCAITIPESGSHMCPVVAVAAYTRIRSAQGTAFFRHFDTSPLTRHGFTRILRRCVSLLELPLQCYTAHSFRIGAATSAAMRGYSGEQIQQMGRWTSQSFRRYIRIDPQ